MELILSLWLFNSMGTQLNFNAPDLIECTCTPDYHSFVKEFNCDIQNQDGGKTIRFFNHLEQPITSDVLIECYARQK